MTILRSFLLAGTVLFLNPAGLSASGGAEDDPISRAQALIIEKQYDQAILILSEEINRNGERMDEAEVLLNRIRSIRNGYNDLFEQLYATILKEPENNDKILGIINQMLALDKYPNAKTREQIEKARLTAKIQVDRRLRTAILEDARALIAAGRYAEAASLYMTGFDLQKPEFEGGIQSAEFKSAFLALVQEIRSESGPFTEGELAFRQWLGTYQSRFSLETPEIVGLLQNDLAALPGIFDRINRTHTALGQYSTRVSDARSQAEKDYPAYIFNEYLRFIQEFMNGPPQKSGSEGILAAARLARTTSVDAWMKPLQEKIRTKRTDLLAYLSTDQLDLAKAGFQDLLPWYALGFPAALATTGTSTPAQFSAATFLASDPQVREQLAQWWLQDQADRRMVRYLDDWSKRPLQVAAGSSFDQLLAAYGQSTTFLTASDEVWTTWTAARAIPLQSVPGAQATALELDALLQGWRSRLAEAILAVNLDTLGRLAAIQYESALAAYTGSQSALSGVNSLIEGVETEPLGVIRRFPDQAIARVVAQEPIIVQAIAQLDQELSRHAQAHPSLRTDRTIQLESQKATQLRLRIVELQNQALAWKARAETNVARSRELQRQADNLAAQTQAAIRDRNIELAESRLTAVQKTYFDALELQENTALRTSSDAAIDGFNKAIINLKIDRALARINTIIKQATTNLDREEYDNALQLVEEGETINAEYYPNQPHPQLTQLKNRILASSTLTRERFFTEADPAYNTLATYLNLARVDVAAARTISGSMRTERLNRANQNISSILRIKPNNWDARLLRLEIDKITDPEAFNRGLVNRVRDILAQETGDNRVGTLTELEILKEYAPNNSLILANIKRLEILLGRRLSDATIADRNESRQKTAQAKELAKSRERSTLEEALRLLSTAIEKDPANDEAKLLADQVRRRIGEPLSVTLSSEDEQLMRKAQRLASTGGEPAAYVIVKTLWEKASNRRHPTIIELKESLERKLDISL